MVDLDLDLEELARLIADAGFTRISLSHDVVHAGYYLPAKRAGLKGLFTRYGLRLNYVHTPLQYYYDLTSLDEQVRRASIEIVKLPIIACAEAGGEAVVLHMMNGVLGPGETDEQHVEAGLASLRTLMDFAGSLGVEVCPENLPLDTDYGRISMAVIRAATWPELGLCLDTCHAWLKSEDPLKLIRELAPRVRLTHLSDTLGEYDSHLIPGDGAVNFPAVARELGRAGFNGVVDLECSLWMLKNRHRRDQLHPGDTVPPSTENYLALSATAARQIATQIEESRQAAKTKR